MRDRQPASASTLIIKNVRRVSQARRGTHEPQLTWKTSLLLKRRDLITSFAVMFLFSVEFFFQTMFFFTH